MVNHMMEVDPAIVSLELCKMTYVRIWLWTFFWFLKHYLTDLKFKNKKVDPMEFEYETYCEGVQLPSIGPMHLLCHGMSVNKYIYIVSD